MCSILTTVHIEFTTRIHNSHLITSVTMQTDGFMALTYQVNTGLNPGGLGAILIFSDNEKIVKWTQIANFNSFYLLVVKFKLIYV